VPKVQQKPYRLFNQDCFDVFTQLKEGSVDLVLCDPPYGTTQNRWDSVIPIAPMWEALRRLIKPDGVMVFTTTQPFSSVLVTSNLEEFKYEWIWRKETPTGFLNARKRPMPQHEQVLVFCRDGGTGLYNAQGLVRANKMVHSAPNSTTNYGDHGGVNWQQWTNWPRSVITFKRDAEKLHPTQKPAALMRYLVRTYSNVGDTVLDFVMGSGTTGVAAVGTGRKFIGCDNDTTHGYFQMAQERIQKAHKTYEDSQLDQGGLFD